MRAMTAAALDAGLIAGTVPEKEREAALFKLMEQGKLLSADILPKFAKQLQNLANNNNGVAIALEKNFAPALSRAQNQLKILSNEFFEGLKPALMEMLGNFVDIGGESGNLAKVLGRTLGNALSWLTFPIRLVVAALADIRYYIKELTGMSDEFEGKLLTWALTAFTLYKVIKKLVQGLALLKGGLKAVEAVKDNVYGTKNTGGEGTDKGRGKRSGGILKDFIAAGIIVGGVEAAFEGVTGTVSRFMNTEERTNAILKPIIDKKIAEQERGYVPNINPYQTPPPKMEVEVKVGVDNNGSIKPYVESVVYGQYDAAMTQINSNY